MPYGKIEYIPDYQKEIDKAVKMFFDSGCNLSIKKVTEHFPMLSYTHVNGAIGEEIRMRGILERQMNEA